MYDIFSMFNMLGAGWIGCLAFVEATDRNWGMVPLLVLVAAFNLLVAFL